MSEAPLELDGSFGEGGGQLLRSALALSLVTGRPFLMTRIRARRRRPGLARQHLAAVRAAATLGAARVTGASLGSQRLCFEPTGLNGGEHRFEIGSAGSAILVLHTLLPALLHAPRAARITVVGGTHNPQAPPFEHFAEAFLPLLQRMGAHAQATLERPGYHPRGGGVVHLETRPGPLAPLVLGARHGPVQLSAEARVAGLPEHIARRELATLAQHLRLPPSALRLRQEPAAWGPGNVCLVRARSPQVTEVFSAFVPRGLPAGAVATAAATATRRYLDSRAAVGTHLADQLMLPLALAGGGRLLVPPPDGHVLANRYVIEAFLPAIRIRLQAQGPQCWRLEVESRVQG